MKKAQRIASKVGKVINSPTAVVEKYRAKFDPKVEQYQYINHEIVPLNSLFCAYHPVTFINDCLKCEMPCTVLEGLIGPELAQVISIEDRNELYMYFFGPDNPCIEIAEKYGITLRVQLIRDDLLYRPKNMLYLNKVPDGKGGTRTPTFAEWRQHWRVYYQGYWFWKAAGTMGQAGMMMKSLPKEMTRYIEYYMNHRNALEGKQTCTMDFELMNKVLPSQQIEMEFENELDAAKYLIRNATRILSKERGITHEDAKQQLIDIITQDYSDSNVSEEQSENVQSENGEVSESSLSSVSGLSDSDDPRR